ncbi:MAG TPA: cyclic nucleotide-binding domain-containing protein, partial [Opitutales bacterium]|nr:cyclic nucleotide-binding domain-containing protein [Opitutales bacterium]
MSPVIGKLLGFCYRWAWGVWIVAIILAVLGALEARHLKLNVSAEGLVPTESPLRETYEETKKTFGSDYVVGVYVEDPDLFTLPKLRRLDALAHKLAELPGVERSENLFNVSSVDGSSGALVTGPILDPLPDTPEEIAAAKARALRNPLIVRTLISPDAKATLLTLFLNADDAQRENFDKEFVPLLKKCIAENQDGFLKDEDGDTVPGRDKQPVVDPAGQFAQVFPIGSPVMHVAIAEYIVRDQLLLLPLACTVLLTLLGLLMRSVHGVIILLINAALANCWTLGLMALLGIPLNMLNYVVPALVVMIGSGSDVHLMIGSGQQRARGLNGLQAISETGRLIGLSLLLNTGSTVLGFASTLLTNIGVLREFGAAAALAIALRFVTSMFVVPAYLRIADRWIKPEAAAVHGQTEGGWWDRWLTRPYINLVSKHLVQHPARVMGACALISGVSLLFARNIRLDNDFAAFLRADSPVMKELNTVSQRLSGTDIVYITFRGDPGEYFRPDRLTQLLKFEEYLRSLPDVDSVTGLPDFLALFNREFNDGDPAMYAIPENPQAVPQCLGMIAQNDLRPYTTPNGAKVNIVLRSNLHNTTRLNQLVDEISTALRSGRFGPQLFAVSGHAVLAAASVDEIASGQVASLTSMVAILGGTVALVFLSWRAAFAAIAANLTPIAIVFAVMAVTHVPLNLGTCMIAAISIGLAVDNTINLMVRYHDDLRRTQTESLALHDTMAAEFKPIVLSGLSMAGGFLALSVSSFVPMQEFGLLSALVMILACFGDLVVTAAMLGNSRIITVWGVLDLHLRKAIVKQSPVFEGFTNWQARKLIAASKIVEREAGAVLIHDGESGDTMYVVLEGELEVTKQAGPQRISINRLGPGQVIGEVALMAKVQRTADVTALTPVKLLSLDWKSLVELQRLSPYLAARLNLNLAKILG